MNLLRRDIDFLLYDWLKLDAVDGLLAQPRYTEHSRETFDAVLDTCQKIAREKFAPANRTADVQEPHFDGEKVHLPESTHAAVEAYVSSGLMSAAQSEAFGGMQLPFTVDMAANAFFSCASVALSGYSMLTVGNANLQLAHASDAQIKAFATNQFTGRFFGTMCLSEPQAGSSLSDVATRAVMDDGADPLGARYRLRGNKMWISGGEHELAENIVHLVLAKIPGADGKLPSGVGGISLFIVPKFLVSPEGELGERNDVVLAGLNHKLGYRGTTNCLLNFGEGRFSPLGRPGAVGYLIGQPGRGLQYMFHMMNEARIGVGMGAALLGYAGYLASLDYARNRPQGRALGPAGKDSGAPQVKIIEHADVRRMLLAQKTYATGAIALGLYCAKLVDACATTEGVGREASHELLEMLTPIVKSWPSEWCLEANSLAIQVLGGYGYTRDFPVEQYWRDNRLNMIHEGTHGIQGLDLLGRKVMMNQGAGLKRLLATMEASAASAANPGHAQALREAMAQMLRTTQVAAQSLPAALANATLYLRAAGHVVLAWIWLELESAAQGQSERDQGLRLAAQYYFEYELPQASAWFTLVPSAAAPRQMQDAWF